MTRSGCDSDGQAWTNFTKFLNFGIIPSVGCEATELSQTGGFGAA